MSWETKNIGDVCEVIAGQSPEGSHYNDKGDGMPFYQGKKEFGEKFIGEPTTWTTYVTKVAEPGDILMSVRAPVGPVNFTSEQICIGRGLAAIRPRSIDKEFLFYSLLAKQDDISGRDGAVFPTINKKEIEAIQLSVPPLPEQQRIVTKLDAAFAALAEAQAHVERNRANARELFESYLNGVFEGKEGWVEVRLGDLVDIQNGYAFKSISYTNSGHFLIRISNVQDGRVTLDNPKYVAIDEPRKERFILDEGDILVSLTGNIGRVGLVKAEHLPAALNQRVARVTIRERKRIQQSFLFFFLRSTFFREHLQNAGHGAAQQNVSTSEIAEVRFNMPPFDEQQQVMEALGAIQEKTAELESTYAQKLLELGALKKSILGAAFRGEL